MSAWATQRKFLISFSFLIIISIIVVIIVFFSILEVPTCNDGIRNQSELGVDCGGECLNACPVPLKPLLNLWTNTFVLGNGVYSAIAYIENQNVGLYVPAIQYEIDFYDEKGTYITSNSQIVPINPGKVTPIFIPSISSGNRKIVSSSFDFVKTPRYVRQQEDYSFTFSDIEIKNPSTNPKIFANAISGEYTDLEEVQFVAIVYDINENAIAASSTIVNNIQPNREYPLTYTWINPLYVGGVSCPDEKCFSEPKRIEIVPVIIQW